MGFRGWAWQVQRGREWGAGDSCPSPAPEKWSPPRLPEERTAREVRSQLEASTGAILGPAPSPECQSYVRLAATPWGPPRRPVQAEGRGTGARSKPVPAPAPRGPMGRAGPGERSRLVLIPGPPALVCSAAGWLVRASAGWCRGWASTRPHRPRSPPQGIRTLAPRKGRRRRPLTGASFLSPWTPPGGRPPGRASPVAQGGGQTSLRDRLLPCHWTERPGGAPAAQNLG